MSAPTDEIRFSAKDLEPDQDEVRAARRGIVDRVGATVAVLAAGVWVGGMVALGACAAPFVFRLTPAPFSGDAMGAAFARFDQIALGASVVLLGAEVARTWAAGPSARSVAARVRRVSAFVMAGCAAYIGLVLSPHINELHRGGALRGVGDLGAELDRTHRTAEAVGKLETGLGVLVVVLHVLTLGPARRREDEEDGGYTAPGIPGIDRPGA
jgi:putative copper export protein